MTNYPAGTGPADPSSAPAAEYRLSRGQDSLWFLYRLAPESPAYHTAFTARCTGGFDPRAFQRAVRSLTGRHTALRTTFAERDGEAFQTVHDRLEPDFEVLDGTGWTEALLHDTVRRAYARPFDLGSGPPLRVLAVRTGTDETGGEAGEADEYVVLLVTHHLVTDFWSTGIVLDELADLYAAEVGHRPARLGERPVPYGDFVRWEREYLAGDRGRQARDYWHQQLSGDLPVTEWPSFRTEPDVPPDAGGSVSFRLSPRLAQDIRALARAERVTPYMLLVTAFQVLIHRYTGQHDVLMGTPASGRTDPDFDECVGYFADPVVLRADFTGAPSFREQLRRTKRTVIGAVKHQEYPFALLVRELGPCRVPGSSPVFQSMFIYNKPQRFADWALLYAGDEDSPPVDWGGLSLRPFPLPQQEGQHDLLLEIVDHDYLHGILKYRRSVFSEDAARRGAEHYRTLLRSIVADPDRRVAELPLTTAEDHRPTTGKVSVEPGDSLLRRFERSVADHADRPAVRFRDTELTYRELDELAGRWAARLHAEGVRQGDRVALLLDRSRDTVLAVLAVLKANAAYVPLDPMHPPARLRMLLDDCGARVVLTQRALTHRIADAPVRGLAMDAPGALDTTRTEDAPRVEPGAGDLLYTIYTSGSTGVPKGIDVEHGNVLSLVDAMHRHVPPDPDTIWSLFHSTAFDVSVWELWGSLLSGACLVVVPAEAARAPDLFRRLLVRERVTHLNVTPSALHGLASEVGSAGSEGLVLRHTFSCGELLLAELARSSLGWCGHLWNLYGPAETTVCVTAQDVGPGECAGTGVPIGLPLANARIYVLDANRQPVPPEITGELYVGGLAVARGYLNRPQLNEERYLPDPFASGAPGGGRMYRTGDLARITADGLLEVLGRADNQVKINGFRVELEEIEATLNREPAVDRSVVLVEGEGADDRRLTGCVVPASGAEPTEAGLRAALQDRLPPYMVPASFVLFDEFPLNPNQKTDRGAVARRVRGERAAAPSPGIAAGPGPARLDDLESTVAGIWKRVLRRDGIGSSDNFFDIGGNSMLLLQVHRQITELPGAGPLAVSELFRYPTVAGLARRLGSPAPAHRVDPAADGDGDGDPGRDRAARRRAMAGGRRRR